MSEDRKEIFKKNEQFPEQAGSVDVINWLVRAGETLPKWYSKRRDSELRRFWKQNDQLAGTMYAMVSRMCSIPIRVEARDKSIVSHVQQAAEYNAILHNQTMSRSDPSQTGWNHGFGMFLTDHYSQDNGSFFVVEGPGKPDGPLTGRPTKLIHLDAYRVTRKSSPEYPITFHDWDGKEYKIHNSRVIAMSSMTSPKQTMYGVGFCAVSRCVNYSQSLADIGVYKQEKLGSRPKERAIIGKKGVTGEDIAQAFYNVDQHTNAQGLRRYAKTAVIAPNERSAASEIDIEVIDLVNAGDVFDEQTSLTLGMYTIALAFGVPARWLWPATASGATKADAQFQHLAGMVQGPGEILRNLMQLLDSKFLPPQLMMVADYQDDEQDRQKAEIKKTRADQRKTDLEDQVITVRVAREQALTAGDITQEQFNDMELEDGRLPSGDSLVSLFNTRDGQLAQLLNLGVENPLDIDANDSVDMIIEIEKKALEATDQTQNASSAQQKRKARLALGALSELKVLYEQRATDEATEEVVAELNMQAQIAQEEAQAQKPAPRQQPEQEAEETTEETSEEMSEEGEEIEEETKAFNFGARAGEVIGGGLARDPQGRFISADQIGAAVRARLMEKIRGRKGEAKTPEENRQAVLQEIADKIPAGGLDALAMLGDGGTPDDGDVSDRLVEMGLAKVGSDGKVRISSSGANVLIAANSGNARRTQEALIRAQAQAGPPKPKAGKKPKAEKPTAEDREQQRAEEDAQERLENRQSIAEALADEQLTAEALEAFNEFFDGADLSEENVAVFAQFGFVELDSRGQPRITAEGTEFIEASNDGRIRRARDLVSVARDRATEETEATEEEKTLVRWIKSFFWRKSQDSYEQGLRRWMRFAWRNDLSKDSNEELFESEMFVLIQENLTNAWKDGIKEIGFSMDELSTEERKQLEQIIKDEQRFIPELTDYFRINSKSRDVPFSSSKVSLWARRYQDVTNKAKAIVGADLKYEWVLGEAEHCRTCAKLESKVKRGSYWEAHVMPQNPPNEKLECKGFECKCSLVPTTKKQSLGNLGSLP